MAGKRTSRPRRAAATKRKASDPQLQRRFTQVQNDLSGQHRLQKALVAMEAFRDQARHQHERLVAVESTLEASRDLYAELYDYAPIGYFTLNLNGVIENVNVTGAAMLKRERAALVGTPFLTLVDRDDWKLFLDHRESAKFGRAVTCELRVQSIYGRSFPVQLSTRESLLPALGRRRCFLTAVLDLTDLRRNEAERMRLATEEQRVRLSNEAKDRFLAMLSHELRTPLTPIVAALSDPDLLRDVPEQLRQTLEMVRRNIAMETQLVEDLLDVSRIEEGKLRVKPVRMDLHEVIKESLALVEPEARQQGIELMADLAAERHWISGDAMRLRQVMWNLLCNAIKFTPRGGSVRVRSINSGSQLTVSVRDTGIGIEPHSIERLFVPFEQVSPVTGTGLGLGLTICRGLVEAHHGTIRAHSEGLGTGATFEMTLPMIDQPVDVPAEAPAEEPAEAAADSPAVASDAAKRANGNSQFAPPAGAGFEFIDRRPKPTNADAQVEAAPALRILLVEDHRDTANVMSRLLRSHGYDVQVAGCLGDAVALAQALAQEPFELAISDITLPDGSGLDLMRHLKESGGVVHGVALSGLASEDDRRRSRDAGFEEHLAKPIDFQKLLSVIEQITSADSSSACST
jgi:two-component system, chemotaxis family, CheB/CheR fusion protein